MRKPGSPAARFWARLVEALGEQGLPTTQIGVARLLGMSQGSTSGWYHGDTLPREIDTYRKLALKGRVTVDWLITGRQPKYPISKDPVLSKIVEICIALDEGSRAEILKAARRELLQKE